MPRSPRNLERLYDDHAQALFGFILNLTRNEAETRDILQDIFCQLAAKPNLLDEMRDARAYLIQMAWRRIIDAGRKRQVRERFAETAREHHPFAAAEDPDENAFREALAAALAELPSEQSAVVHLKLWEQMTFEQIATTLDTPPNTAASRYRYGIDKLRTLLRPIYEEIQ